MEQPNRIAVGPYTVEWIKITEDQNGPEEGVNVITYHAGHGHSIAMRLYYGWVDFEGDKLHYIPTHWLPMPECPKE